MLRIGRLIALRLLDPEDALTEALAAEARASGMTMRVAQSLDAAIEHWTQVREDTEAEVRAAIRPRVTGLADLAVVFPVVAAINERRGYPFVTFELDRLVASELQRAVAEGRRRAP
ncbi:hypothetical protein [Roseicella frigidaeris]|uniref:hypothetical protein n=1 Tax=Roseicella frigidaeris TaxID=2230885 RepID=UPI000FDE634D|nr:hypothetical protein [Roseicella frigidaeris]